MPNTMTKSGYRPTESKYKGGAHEMYVTYDLEQRTRGGGTALYPKVKRVYIAGDVKGWHVGSFEKKSGRAVYGAKIDYEQTRQGYEREGFTATRDHTEYAVSAAEVPPSSSSFSQIVEVPEKAQNIRFHTGKLPEKYRHALQDVR